MNPPIHAFQQHHVHPVQQLRDRIDNLDTHPAQLFGETLDAVATGWDVRAARIAGHHFDTGQVAGRVGVVEDFRESRHMRGVEANHAGAEWR